jgi:WD40 repeat protein
VIALTSSPDGKHFASGGWDFVIKIWSIPKAALIGNLIGHKDCVNQLRYSPDGNVLFSCSVDRTIKLWMIQRMELLININVDYEI